MHTHLDLAPFIGLATDSGLVNNKVLMPQLLRQQTSVFEQIFRVIFPT